MFSKWNEGDCLLMHVIEINGVNCSNTGKLENRLCEQLLMFVVLLSVKWLCKLL